MSTTLTKPKRPTKLKPGKPEPEGWQNHSHTPNYIYLLPPGEIIEEKMFEMGIDAAELARRMEVPVEIIEQLLCYEIPLTQEVAEKLEKATWMSACAMMRHEASYRAKLVYAAEHPEIPAYLGDVIVNQQR
jgi:plasmid maintenance system antidote protein VapI